MARMESSSELLNVSKERPLKHRADLSSQPYIIERTVPTSENEYTLFRHVSDREKNGIQVINKIRHDLSKVSDFTRVIGPVEPENARHQIIVEFTKKYTIDTTWTKEKTAKKLLKVWNMEGREIGLDAVFYSPISLGFWLKRNKRFLSVVGVVLRTRHTYKGNVYSFALIQSEQVKSSEPSVPSESSGISRDSADQPHIKLSRPREG